MFAEADESFTHDGINPRRGGWSHILVIFACAMCGYVRKIRIHRDTKTGNDEWLPGVAPLVKLLSDGWEQSNLRRAEYEIRKKIKGTNLAWRGWYAFFRRGLATNLYRCGMRPEKACLILRNSAEVVRRHYIRLEQQGTKVDAMTRLEQAYNECAANVQ